MDHDKTVAEVRGYGITAKFFGQWAKPIITMVTVLAIVAFALWELERTRAMDKEARAALAQEHKTTQSLIASVITRTDELIKLLNENRNLQKEGDAELSYILTLTQQKRENLRLEMPQSLRRKMGDRG